MSDKPPPFKGYSPVSNDDLWTKILSGEIEPHIYSGEAKGDFEPVRISSAEFFKADEAGRNEDGEPDAQLKPYQIMWRDRDQRRQSAVRRAIPVPHWVYVVRQASPAPKQTHQGAPKSRRHTAPEQLRAAAVLKSLFGDTVPSREQLTDGDLLRMVNNHIGKAGRRITRDSLLRASGRRPSK